MDSRVIEIFTRLRRQMNGAVTESMEQRGTHYGMNYGVSVATIRDIAAGYAPDHELALALYAQEVREMQIAAIYIDDYKRVTVDQMEQWSNAWQTSEMAEQSSMQLFWRAEDAMEIARRWLLGSSEPLRRLAASNIIGRLASELTDLDQVISWPLSDYALREIYRHKPLYRKAIRSIAGEELIWQLDYLDELTT